MSRVQNQSSPNLTQRLGYRLPVRQLVAQRPAYWMDMTVPQRIVAAARRLARERPYDWAWAEDRSGGRTVHFWGLPTYVAFNNTEFCNLYVGEVLHAASVDNPLRLGGRGSSYPIPADWWFEARETDNNGWIGGLNYSIFPREILHPIPGDIISDGEHVGIVTVSNRDGTGRTISAPAFTATHKPNNRPADYRRNAIIENDWGFRPGTASKMRISRHSSVERPSYAQRIQTGRPQPEQ
ncbi:MAG TPA: hypothetical protein VLS89_03885 [Candidatus Nanopelagicales bacterium]|nr:hypothetical protein [Candidatus Nanopelagicales bacterium]